jgi:hypothetical protein
VWFVDSDDDIDLGALDVAEAAQWDDADLIAWDWHHPTIQRRIIAEPGVGHSLPAPPDIFDPIVANWYALDFLKRSRLRFPENCIYEATPIEAFVLPLLVSRYATSNFKAYLANTHSPSVTRASADDPRLFDRLQTVSLGMRHLRQSGIAAADRAPFDAAFTRLFLWYSIRLSRRPGKSWLTAARVMRRYRDEARELDVRGDPFALYPGRSASKRVMRAIWLLSHALPSQKHYFHRLHMCAWGRPITWDPPRAATAAGSSRPAPAGP